MNKYLLRCVVVGGLFCLSACSILSPKAEYIPDNRELKPATVGVPYFVKIDIIGGRVIGGWYHPEPQYRPGLVTPNDAGIFLRNCQLTGRKTQSLMPKERLYNGNCIEVYGTPLKAGELKININGGMYGNMFAPASEFSKEYTLNVVEP
ncbi:hypothetical protein [Buttiauxella sp.]|uniref:hypothetical protein n=1 Tax=Buttiauxella sp. TaxID=1972222 RepID=UPI003C77EBA4